MSRLKQILRRKSAPLGKVQPGAYPFLVTGCARSGTHFLAKFLELNGLDLGHESSGKMGTVAWLCAAGEVRREKGVSFEKTAHLIRDPARTLKSLQTMTSQAWNYIFRYAPECRHDDLIVASARYWLRWNQMAFAQSSLSVRLEDFETAAEQTVAKFSEFFSYPLDPGLIGDARAFGDSRMGREGYGHDVHPQYIRDKDPDTYGDMRVFGEQFGYRLQDR